VLGDDEALLASGGDDGTVRLWNPERDPHARGCMRIGGRVNALCALEDRLLVGTAEGHVVIDFGRE
jgi:WD40 repeat protein